MMPNPALPDVGALVLVTGGTGSLGPSVVNALRRADFAVRVFSNDTPAAGLLPPDVDVCTGDVCDAGAVRAAMSGVSGVIHMAALLHVENPAPELTQRYDQVNVEGTATVVEAAMDAKVARLVYVSTISVYGAGTGALITETARPEPDSPYARTKLAGEQHVLAARGSDQAPLGTVLRLAAIYGPRVKGHYQRLVRALAAGRFLPVGPCTNRRTVVFHEDAANAAVLALTHESSAGRIYNITDGKFHRTDEIIAAICEALGRKPPRFALPVAPIRGMLRLVDSMAWALPTRLPVSAKTIDKFLEDVAVDGSLAQAELGFVPQYDLRAGWRETVTGMRLGHAGQSETTR